MRLFFTGFVYLALASLLSQVSASEECERYTRNGEKFEKCCAVERLAGGHTKFVCKERKISIGAAGVGRAKTCSIPGSNVVFRRGTEKCINEEFVRCVNGEWLSIGACPPSDIYGRLAGTWKYNQHKRHIFEDAGSLRVSQSGKIHDGVYEKKGSWQFRVFFTQACCYGRLSSDERTIYWDNKTQWHR